jgi:Protein of unknown function (DUF3866)
MFRRGKVVAISAERAGALELDVEIDGSPARALAYPDLTGPIGPGDPVLLNSTAVELGLGTGGFHLVVAVEDAPLAEPTPEGRLTPEGRVMKARYTPLQTAVRSVEESDPDAIEGVDLDGMPVVCAPLHSMIAPVAAGAKATGADRVVYVMTDAAALPGPFSRLVPELRASGLLDGFVTAGQAFGGELEAVTVWTGLLAARRLLDADVAIVADGPGNLGTETTWGVSALGTGNALNAAAMLGGRPIAAIRVSFADARDRHRGLSHHSRTILARVCLVPATVAVPVLSDPERDLVWSALRELGGGERLDLVEADATDALQLLRDRGVDVESMGRTAEDDPAFFLAAGAAGVVAGRMASGQPLR